MNSIGRSERRTHKALAELSEQAYKAQGALKRFNRTVKASGLKQEKSRRPLGGERAKKSKARRDFWCTTRTDREYQRRYNDLKKAGVA